jgi:hypothetical protein
MLYGCTSVKSQVSGSNGPLPACPLMQLSRAVRVQSCVLSEVVMSAQAGRGAVDIYGRRGNDVWCVLR